MQPFFVSSQDAVCWVDSFRFTRIWLQLELPLISHTLQSHHISVCCHLFVSSLACIKQYLSYINNKDQSQNKLLCWVKALFLWLLENSLFITSTHMSSTGTIIFFSKPWKPSHSQSFQTTHNTCIPHLTATIRTLLLIFPSQFYHVNLFLKMPNEDNQDSYSWPSIKQPPSIKWPVINAPK